MGQDRDPSVPSFSSSSSTANRQPPTETANSAFYNVPIVPRPVAVYSRDPDLAERIRAARPSLEVIAEGDGRDACRVAVLDEGEPRPGGKSLARILLGGEGSDARRQGELRVGREEFLRAPGEYLGFVQDLADAALHAAQLENEALYLHRIQELMALTDEGEVSQRITETVLDMVALPHGSLFLHDPRLERYVVSYSNDPDYRESNEFLPGIPPDVLQRALTARELFATDRDAAGRGIMVMPLQVDQDLLGVIRVPLAAGDEVGEEARENVTQYLGAVVQVLSNIYQLTRSRDLAMRDDLTKAFNRRFFETYLDEEIERSRRYGAQFSIIFLDLDDLKSVNNLYGHLFGSRTLQEVAKRILAAVRGIDKVVRFGGAEFMVLLPQTDGDQAVAVANRIGRAISSSPLHIDAAVDVSITASFGIATYPMHGLTKEGLVRQADAAMYRVKSTTKNAVGVADSVGSAQ